MVIKLSRDLKIALGHKVVARSRSVLFVKLLRDLMIALGHEIDARAQDRSWS